MAHEGMTVSGEACGTYRFVVGPKVWHMQVNSVGTVTVSGPEAASDVIDKVKVTGIITYDSEKTWIRNFSGKANGACCNDLYICFLLRVDRASIPLTCSHSYSYSCVHVQS